MKKSFGAPRRSKRRAADGLPMAVEPGNGIA